MGRKRGEFDGYANCMAIDGAESLAGSLSGNLEALGLYTSPKELQTDKNCIDSCRRNELPYHPLLQRNDERLMEMKLVHYKCEHAQSEKSLSVDDKHKRNEERRLLDLEQCQDGSMPLISMPGSMTPIHSEIYNMTETLVKCAEVFGSCEKGSLETKCSEKEVYEEKNEVYEEKGLLDLGCSEKEEFEKKVSQEMKQSEKEEMKQSEKETLQSEKEALEEKGSQKLRGSEWTNNKMSSALKAELAIETKHKKSSVLCDQTKVANAGICDKNQQHTEVACDAKSGDGVPSLGIVIRKHVLVDDKLMKCLQNVETKERSVRSPYCVLVRQGSMRGRRSHRHRQGRVHHKAIKSRKKNNGPGLWGTFRNTQISVSSLGRQCPGSGNSGGRGSGGDSSTSQSLYCGGGGRHHGPSSFSIGGRGSGGGGGGSGRDGDEDKRKREEFHANKKCSKRQMEEDEKKKSKNRLENGILDWLMPEDNGLPRDFYLQKLKECLMQCLIKNNSNGHTDCHICGKLTQLLSHFNECLHPPDECYCSSYIQDAMKSHSMPCCQSLCTCSEYLARLQSRRLSTSILHSSSPNAAEDNLDSESVFMRQKAVQILSRSSSESSLVMPSSEVLQDEKLPCETQFSIFMASLGHSSPRPAVNSDLVPRGGRFEASFPGAADLNSVFSSVHHPSEAIGNEEHFRGLGTGFGPRMCISEAFPGGASSLQGIMTSVPTRSRGSVFYGSKMDLQRLACLWQSYAQQPEQFDRKNLRNIPVEGVILTSGQSRFMIVNGNYDEDQEWAVVSEPLGAGTSGRCYVAVDYNTGEHFCVKRISLLHFNATEIEIWSILESPGIVELYGAMISNEEVYIFQELILGPTLKEFISLRGQVDPYLALLVLEQLLNILKYLKSKRVIHEDIKADNLMFHDTDTFRIVMIDFGLSRNTSSVGHHVNPVGSQTQWSPEKAASEGYSFGADLWAAIAVFVHMLSGSEPWLRRFEDAGYLHYIIKINSPPLDDVPPGLPESINNLIHQGWTVNPSERPTVEALLDHKAFKLHDLLDAAEIQSHLSFVNESLVSRGGADALDWSPDDMATELLISQCEELAAELKRGALLLQLRSLSLNLPEEDLVSEEVDTTLNPEFVISQAEELLSASCNPVLPSIDIPQTGGSLEVVSRELQDAAQSGVAELREVEEGENMEASENVSSSDNDVQEEFTAVFDKKDFIFERHSSGCVLRLPPEKLAELTQQYAMKRSPSAPGKKSHGATSVVTRRQASAPAFIQPASTSWTSIENVMHTQNSVSNYGARPKIPSNSNFIGNENTARVPSGGQPPLPVCLEWFSISSDDNDETGSVKHEKSCERSGETPMSNGSANGSANFHLEPNNWDYTPEQPPVDSSLLTSASIGTIIAVFMNGERVYSTHLLPGIDHSWSDVLRRASDKIHVRGLNEFTARVVRQSSFDEINIDEQIPPEAHVQVEIFPVGEDWDWKIENSRVVFNQSYQGQFGPRYDD